MTSSTNPTPEASAVDAAATTGSSDDPGLVSGDITINNQGEDSNDDDTANAMMHRLQSQFGDMDLTHLLSTSAAHKNPDDDNSSSSSSSALAEPSPEEIRAWQEAQFQKGRAVAAAKRNETLGAVQKRREALKQQTKNSDTADDDDWEYLPARPNLQGQTSVFFPTSTAASSDKSSLEMVGVHPLLQQLSRGDPEILGTSWKRLYGSAHGDGLAFVNLWDKLQGYPGPTVLLLGAVPSQTKSLTATTTTSRASRVLGFYTTSPWVESTTMTGSSDCFLFSFDDDDNSNPTDTENKEDPSTISFFRPKDNCSNDDDNTPNNNSKKHYMYCHPSTSSHPTTNGLVDGLGVGGTPSQPRLHISESLEDCRALPYCSLFEPGDLFGTKHASAFANSLQYFDVDALEVWAVGGQEWIDESLETQKRHQAVLQANRAKTRKVDKEQFLRDFQSGMFSSTTSGGGGMFAHQNEYNADRCDL